MSMKPLSAEDQERLFRDALTAIFCTVNKDGMVHAVPIWYLYRDGVFHFMMGPKSRKAVNIRRNNSVTLSIMIQGEGDVPSLVSMIYGTAEIETPKKGDSNELFPLLLERYMTKEEIEKTADSLAGMNWVTVKVRPGKIIAYHP